MGPQVRPALVGGVRRLVTAEPDSVPALPELSCRVSATLPALPADSAIVLHERWHWSQAPAVSLHCERIPCAVPARQSMAAIPTGPHREPRQTRSRPRSSGASARSWTPAPRRGALSSRPATPGILGTSRDADRWLLRLGRTASGPGTPPVETGLGTCDSRHSLCDEILSFDVERDITNVNEI